MAQKLTDAIVKALAVPPSGEKITYDEAVKGFGIRVTAAGARSFVLNYRTGSDANGATPSAASPIGKHHRHEPRRSRSER